MRLDAAVDALKPEIVRVRDRVPNAGWFLFGSALRDPRNAVDIDLAVTCEDDQEVAAVRHELSALCLRIPLHLFLMTKDEERELDFINAVGAVPLLR